MYGMSYDEVMQWFARWDELAVKGDVEQMADMALFPINTVTDGSATSWDRERFIKEMGAQLGGGGEVKMESTRTPISVVSVASIGSITSPTSCSARSGGQSGTGLYEPMPPVLGPSSPSPTLL